MAAVSAKLVKELRDKTGAGMMDCKNALTDAEGNFDRALEIIREKGKLIASKRADRDAAEGVVLAKVTNDNKFGAMLVLNCETDFVARTASTKAFAYDIAMHIAALKPLFLSSENVDAAFLAKEEEIAREVLKNEGKPAAISE